jgi:hypothetical protein
MRLVLTTHFFFLLVTMVAADSQPQTSMAVRASNVNFGGTNTLEGKLFAVVYSMVCSLYHPFDQHSLT